MACECGAFRLEVAAQRAEMLSQRELLRFLNTTMQNVERQNAEILSKLTVLSLDAITANQPLPVEPSNKAQQPISASQLLENNLEIDYSEETAQTANYTPSEENHETVAAEAESTSAIVTTLELVPPKVGNVTTTADYTPTEETQETVTVEEESTSGIFTTLGLLPPKVDQDDLFTVETVTSDRILSLIAQPEASLGEHLLSSSVNSSLNNVKDSIVEAKRSTTSREASDLAILYSSVSKPVTRRSKDNHISMRRKRFRQSGNLADESIQNIAVNSSQRPQRFIQSGNPVSDQLIQDNIMANTSQRPKRISQTGNRVESEPTPIERTSDLSCERLSKSKSSKFLLICSGCTKTFNTYSAMRDHIKTSSSCRKQKIVPKPIVKSKIFTCFKCGFETVVLNVYLSHKESESCREQSRKSQRLGGETDKCGNNRRLGGETDKCGNSRQLGGEMEKCGNSRRLSGETDKCGKSSRLCGETAFNCKLCDFRSSEKSNIELHCHWHEQCELKGKDRRSVALNLQQTNEAKLFEMLS